MLGKTNKYVITAVLLGIIFHGTSMFFTLEKTYDALIHVFFGNHYATNWFETWNYSWYTGFTVTGYPPLVHQAIGLLSYLGGLKFGLYVVALLGVILFITGIYRFSFLIIPDKKIAGFTAIVTVFSSCFVETLHIFGQLPSIIGISILLHALPEIYTWLKTGSYFNLIKGLALMAVTVTSHHVTPIFGMVFFIFPLIGMVLMDHIKDVEGSYKKATFYAFAKALLKHLKRILFFGFTSLILIIGCILPYWINTKNNPITQVPIPHGSRDNFIDITSSGLVFFIIPWGILLFLFPYFFYRFFSKRLLFFGISFTLLFILGTGGTTPIPLLILGKNAFNILTLDRFTLWGSIMALPLFGEFCYRFVMGDYKEYLQTKWSPIIHRITGGFLAVVFIAISIFTMTLGKFRPSQPDPIKMTPIVNFLNEDEHYKWRYLPLGFGDQMAWLSAQTKATTVDGNYHSARRLPELTSRAVERLENSKYRGIEGLGSLQEFLTVPEKYHLKYVFSNDKFYDPLLYFTGWHRLNLLENGVTVWEKSGITPLPSILPKDVLPLYQKLLWGIVPVSTVCIALLLSLLGIWRKLAYSKVSQNNLSTYRPQYKGIKKYLYTINSIWSVLLTITCLFFCYTFYIQNDAYFSTETLVKSYYDAIDYKEFEEAHSYLDPESNTSLSQFMLEISVSDGLLSSYAKLNTIDIKTLRETDTTATVQASMEWITPLKEIRTSEIHKLKRIKSKWYIIPDSIDPDIPPDQFIIQSGAKFYNHGKRTITSKKTYHKDVLKQPVVEVLEASLVKKDSAYSVLGEIQNIDNIPSDISVTAILYDSYKKEIGRYDAQDIVKHKLLPKEATPFRIDFNSIKPSLTPTYFEVQVKSNVAIHDLYQPLVVSNTHQVESKLNGFLFNNAVQEATIPQLLLSYYNDKDELIWVDTHYIDESVRQQRKRPFELKLYNEQAPQILKTGTESATVNGLSNTDIARKVFPERRSKRDYRNPISIQNMSYRYITIKNNIYIGNPN